MGMILLGFSAGLPYLLVFSSLSAWLRDAEVSRSTIGFFAWIGITYSVKVFWAPVIDRLQIPVLNKLLGQRRSWMLIGQIGIGIGLVGMSFVDPSTHLWWMAIFGVLVAFSSSTQDVAIDAFRIESAEPEFQGAMSAAYILGYRLALLVSGAGALYIAHWYTWQHAYWVMAALMLIGVFAVFWLSESSHSNAAEKNQIENKMVQALFGRDIGFESFGPIKRWLVGAVFCPFIEFFKRNGKFAIIILLFIALFRLSDITMGIMANPFYLDMGFSKADIASIAKLFGFFMTIIGSFLCGIWVVKWGLYKPLLLGAILVSSTNVLFALLATQEPSLIWLATVISADNLSGGIASTAFIAYLSSLTNSSYTATQYALFSSLMTLPGKFISGFSGVIVDASSYAHFFLSAAALGIPAILLVLLLMKHERKNE
jgi:PAT family beta-lactamase induction signal transducer AmpG